MDISNTLHEPGNRDIKDHGQSVDGPKARLGCTALQPGDERLYHAGVYR